MISFDQFNGLLYVMGGPDFNEIYVLYPSNGSEVAPVRNSTGGSQAWLLVDPANGNILLGVAGTRLAVVNISTNWVFTPTQLPGVNPWGIFGDPLTFDPLTGDAYYVAYGNNGSSTIYVVNGTTYRVVTSFSIPWYPQGAAYDPYNGDIYFSTGWGIQNLTIVSGSTNEIIETVNGIPVGPGVIFDSLNRDLYVTGYYAQDQTGHSARNVTVFNPVTDTIVTRIPVGHSPFYAALDPRNNYLYVANRYSSNLSVISTLTNQVVGSIPTLPGPIDITYDDVNGALFVTSSGNNITEIIPSYRYYNITFDAPSLPVGTNWSVSVNGANYTSSSPRLQVSELNGSYTYLVHAPTGFAANPAGGTVSVNGSEVNVTIALTATTGTVTGNVQPATALVWLGGSRANVTTRGNFSFTHVPAGVGLLRAAAAGYVNYSSNISVMPGGITQVSIRLTPRPGAALNGGGNEALLLSHLGLWIGGVAVGAVLGVAATALYYRRRPTVL
ncbi:MAG: YncE family protein [Sulfobacillus sp.]